MSHPHRLVVWPDTLDQPFSEVLAHTEVDAVGTDTVVIDTEHGASGDDAILRFLGSLKAHGLEAFVRVSQMHRSATMQPREKADHAS